MNLPPTIYEKEFQLNLKHQINSKDLKDIYYVGYQIENQLLATIMIPKRMLAI